jgi:7SK snRNA methylphosphate capping enzyme
MMMKDGSTVPQQNLVSNIRNPNDQMIQRFKITTNNKISDESMDRSFLERISFKKENFIEKEQPDIEDLQKYDIIFCMSVSKWIHLNFGDKGITILFHKVYQMLKPGGLFVFEPQLWKSYTKRDDLTKKMKRVFKTIKLKPKEFHEYLLNTVGFVKSETYFLSKMHNEEEISTNNNSVTDNKNDIDKESKKKKGFKDRPICFYYKALLVADKLEN